MARTALIAAVSTTILGAGAPLDPAPATSPAAYAAPWAIIAHGRLLPQRVVIADWYENHRLMLASPAPGTSTASSALSGRPSVDLALFWGPEWAHLEKTPAAAVDLRVEQANQRGRLYLATGEAPAILVLYGGSMIEALSGPLMARIVAPDGLKMLEAHGIPVRGAP
jgi:hypothetical protein